MAQVLSEVHDLSEWPAFRRRVLAAMIVAAKDVGAEPADQTPRSTLRRALSVNVFTDLDGYTRRFAVAVAANPVIGFSSSDSDIQFTVNSVWDTIAGAPPATEP